MEVNDLRSGKNLILGVHQVLMMLCTNFGESSTILAPRAPATNFWFKMSQLPPPPPCLYVHPPIQREGQPSLDNFTLQLTITISSLHQSTRVPLRFLVQAMGQLLLRVNISVPEIMVQPFPCSICGDHSSNAILFSKLQFFYSPRNISPIPFKLVFFTIFFVLVQGTCVFY